MDQAPNHSTAEFALRERVKELTCLYAISELAQEEHLTFDELLHRIVRIIPPAWQYPEHTAVSIRIDEKSYTSAEVPPSPFRQSEVIQVKGKARGAVEVVYTAPMPQADEGPFLKEERNLIKAIAHKLAMLIERKEASEEKERLNEQILHADRLATIGELAAGIAHELNEPLANILGFAQLVQKEAQLPETTQADLEKIIKATLHARAIIKKLMYFSHQMPQRFSDTDLNHIIRETMYFLETRCTRAGVQVGYDLDETLPYLYADPVQLNQVVVNLVMNAIQAMPEGGRLNIATRQTSQAVTLTVEDTGEGIPPELIDQIFTPFLTTKEIGKGTGLGLSVVHGIVATHGGEIRVESSPGKGTRFDIHFPLKPAHV